MPRPGARPAAPGWGPTRGPHPSTPAHTPPPVGRSTPHTTPPPTPAETTTCPRRRTAIPPPPPDDPTPSPLQGICDRTPHRAFHQVVGGVVRRRTILNSDMGLEDTCGRDVGEKQVLQVGYDGNN